MFDTSQSQRESDINIEETSGQSEDTGLTYTEVKEIYLYAQVKNY